VAKSLKGIQEVKAGLQPVEIINKKTGEKKVEYRELIRYRVRIQRRNFKNDKTFDTPEEALSFLADSKSAAGRQAILKQDVADAARVKAIADFLHAPKLEFYLEKWAEELKLKIPSKKNELKAFKSERKKNPALEFKPITDAERKRKSVALNRLEVIKRVVVEYESETSRLATGQATTGVFAAIVQLPKKPFGEFQLSDVSSKTGSHYIAARLAQGVSLATVKRDVGCLSSFFGTWLPVFDEVAANKLGVPVTGFQ